MNKNYTVPPAKSLTCFQHSSYYHVAFQKPSLSHPVWVRRQGTLCIWNSMSTSSLLSHRYKHTPSMHTQNHSHPSGNAVVTRKRLEGLWATARAGFRLVWTEVWPHTWQLRRMTDTYLKHSSYMQTPEGTTPTVVASHCWLRCQRMRVRIPITKM